MGSISRGIHRQSQCTTIDWPCAVCGCECFGIGISRVVDIRQNNKLIKRATVCGSKHYNKLRGEK